MYCKAMTDCIDLLSHFFVGANGLNGIRCRDTACLNLCGHSWRSLEQTSLSVSPLRSFHSLRVLLSKGLLFLLDMGFIDKMGKFGYYICV